MSRTHHHLSAKHQKRRHPPRWFTGMKVVRPERQENRRLVQNILKTKKLDELIDSPEFAKGNKPDASWDWD